MNGRARRLSILRWVLAFAILSTALHFTHNFVEIDQYPDDLVGGTAVQVGIVVSWPLFTALALLGYRLYSRGSFATAHGALVGYGFFCLISLGHFLDGSPDIPAFWLATIFTDALAGLAVLGFVAGSARAPVPQ